MTTLETQNKNKSAPGSHLVVLLISVFFLNFGFKMESSAHAIGCRNARRGDTLAAGLTEKAKAAKIKMDGANQVASSNQGLFLPVDPDDANLPQKMVDAAGSFRARMAMKVYLDSLIIGPKANDLLKMAKNQFNWGANQPNAGKNVSLDVFRQVILLLAP